MAARPRGRRGGGIFGQRTRSTEHVVHEFVPSSAWSEDSNGHYLLVDLPEFRKEEVRLQVDNSGNITVSGERMVNSDIYVYFEQIYKMPENSDIDNISGKFDGEILHVTVPKLLQLVEENDSDESDHNDADEYLNDTGQVPSNINGKDSNENDTSGHQDLGDQDRQKAEEMEKKKKRNAVDGFRREILMKWGQEDLAAPLERAMKMIKKNKAILLTAVVAFSLGVLVSRSAFKSAGD